MAGLWDFMSPGGLWNTPGYGDGLPQNGYRLPDQMPAINDALAQNAAITPPQQGFDIRQMILNGIGGGADALATMNGAAPQYGPAVEQRRQLEADQAKYEKRRQDENADWQAREQWKRDNPEPDLPGIADETAWYNSLPDADKAKADAYLRLRYPGNYVPPAPVVMEPGDVIQGDTGGGPQTATNPQTGEKVRFNPQTGQWEPVGGASPSNGSGGFQF